MGGGGGEGRRGGADAGAGCGSGLTLGDYIFFLSRRSREPDGEGRQDPRAGTYLFPPPPPPLCMALVAP